MFDGLKALFKSRKFYYVVIGTIVVNIMAALGLPEDLILTVAGFFGVGIAGQSVADAGKEAAKAKNGG